MITHAKRASLLVALILAACVAQSPPPPMPPPMPPPPPPPVLSPAPMQEADAFSSGRARMAAGTVAPYAQTAPQPMPGDV
ncbi:MAG TPA: hypothetical protein VFO00_06765, partial [Vitreimonas sp.]|nr:hypothetical protein [Vitreimonas sp.]